MSALGQKPTYAVQKGMSAVLPIATAKADMPQMLMSALPPKADMCGALGHVCFGPKADMVRLFETKTLFVRPARRTATSTIRSAIVKMGQILFIFCARDYAALLLDAGTVFSR